MTLEPWRWTRRDVLKAAGLALMGGVWAGCDDDLDIPPSPGTPAIFGSFRIIGEGMYEAFKRWLKSLTPGDRAIIEALMQQEDLLIHIFLATGRLRPLDSRGGASTQARYMKQVCDFHPIIDEFALERDWDVAYDPERAKWFERMYGIPNPPEVVLYHEIFGHVIPGLRDPEIVRMAAKDKVFKMKKECEALDIENRYRTQLKFPVVSRELIKCPPQ